jgi:hypothetical protein
LNAAVPEGLSRLPWELDITHLLATLELVDGTARYSTRRTIEDHEGPRRREGIALRAQCIAAFLRGPQRPPFFLRVSAFFRSADIHATIEVPGCLHASSIRSNVIRLPSIGSRHAQDAARHGKWRPASLDLWAKIGKQVCRHRLHIVAPAGVEPSRGALPARHADGEGWSVFRDCEFELKPTSAVSDDDR